MLSSQANPKRGQIRTWLFKSLISLKLTCNFNHSAHFHRSNHWKWWQKICIVVYMSDRGWTVVKLSSYSAGDGSVQLFCSLTNAPAHLLSAKKHNRTRNPSIGNLSRVKWKSTRSCSIPTSSNTTTVDRGIIVFTLTWSWPLVVLLIKSN